MSPQNHVCRIDRSVLDTAEKRAMDMHESIIYEGHLKKPKPSDEADTGVNSERGSPLELLLFCNMQNEATALALVIQPRGDYHI